MQCHKFIPKLFVGFGVLRIDDDGIVDRADALTGWFIIMSDAFRTPIAVNFVNLIAHRDRLIRALRFAHIAINAFVCDQQGHDVFSYVQ